MHYMNDSPNENCSFGNSFLYIMDMKTLSRILSALLLFVAFSFANIAQDSSVSRFDKLNDQTFPRHSTTGLAFFFIYFSQYTGRK